MRTAKAGGGVQCFQAFDRFNANSVTWADQHSAELVKGISDESRKAIQKVISRSFAEGIPPKQAALMIQNSVTMTEAQANAVVNLHQTIITSPGKLVYAGKTPIRVPAAGMDSARLDKVLQDYADRLTRQRAIAIARTETIEAANQGQMLLWGQAQEKGLLPKVIKHEWVAAGSERTCPICQGADGEVVVVGELFSTGVTSPPAHPMCRCTTGLA